MHDIVTAQHDSQPITAELKYTYAAEFIKWIDRGENTTRAYIINLRQFFLYLLYAGISRPEREDILNYKQWLLSEHDAIIADPVNPQGYRYRTDKAGNRLTIKCKPTTAAQYLRIVCQFFKWTAASGLYPDIATNIHAPKLNTRHHSKRALTAHEVLQIENSIIARGSDAVQKAQEVQKDTAGRMQRAEEQSKRLFAMYLLAVNAGLRTIELHRANIKDIEFIGGRARLYVWGKGHSQPDQIKPLAFEVAKALKDYINSRTDNPTGNSPLFVSTGNRSKGKRIAVTTISMMLKRAMQAAGFDSEKITAHSLRHTAGTNVQEITNNLYLTQQYMRHSNPATTEIYLHVNTEKQEAEISEQLYRHYHADADPERPQLAAGN